MAARRTAKAGQPEKKGSLPLALVRIVATACLFASLLGLGLFICCAPPATYALSGAFSEWQGTAFTRQQMVDAAMATRDYTVAGHDGDALYRTLFEINRESQGAGREAFPGAPALPGSPDPTTAELESSFDGASDRYVLTGDALSHLDDVYQVISTARAVLAVVAVLAAAGCVMVGLMGGRRRLGATLMTAGALVIALFALLGVWAVLDFNGLFAFIHSLFFAQGTWVFSANSLLIRMYPLPFWTGMGTVWLGSAILASLLCLILGLFIKGRRRRTP